MDCYAAAAGGLQPPQQGLRRVAQVGRAEGVQPPLGDVRVVVLGPGVQARQGDWRQLVTTLAPVVFLAASRVPSSVTPEKPALRMTALAILGWSAEP